jgi:hypothetical protein
MSKSRRIDEIFAECLEQVFNGESIERCVGRYPEQAEELRKLLATAVAARKAAAVEPTPEYRVRARAQLQAALREKAANKAAATAARKLSFSWNWQPRWAVALTAAVVVLLGGSGTVLAANNSMPGQPLYAVKLASEKVQLAITTSATAKAEVYAGLAERRVNEIVYLAANGEPQRIEQVTKNLDLCLTNISDLSGGVSENALFSARNADDAATTKGTAEYGESALEQNLAVPAAITTAAADTTAVTVNTPPPAGGGEPAASVQESALPLYSNDVTAADGKLMNLKIKVYYQSVEYPEILKKALDDADPETRLALLEAIAVSETGYERILQVLQYSR